MQDRLLNKVILITGAARGIGAAIGTIAARQSATVLLTDLDPGGASLAEKLRAEGCSAEFADLDVSDPARWRKVIDTALERHGRIDGLVNNAAVQTKYRPLELPEPQWERCLEVNLRGAWHGCRTVLPAMLARRTGSIVNIASVHAHQIIPGAFPYSVSKHGLIGLTRALGVEYAPQGIRVNAISPGYIDTEPDWWTTQADPGALAACEALIPARRLGRPEEVAMTAVFLLSDEAPYIVATAIKIDGGRLELFHE